MLTARTGAVSEVSQKTLEIEAGKRFIAKRRKDWCERGDSNPHGFTRQILSLVRLPIPPLSHTAELLSSILNAFVLCDFS
jgi:hypothetical protein